MNNKIYPLFAIWLYRKYVKVMMHSKFGAYFNRFTFEFRSNHTEMIIIIVIIIIIIKRNCETVGLPSEAL